MRQRQNIRGLYAVIGSVLRKGSGCLAMATSLLLWQYTGSAQAQFTGPALQTSPTANLPVKPTTDPAILYPAPRDIRLAQGDLVGFHLYGTTDYSPTVRVSEDGSVQLPLIGVVHIGGLTLQEAQTVVADRLSSAGMFLNPQVTIQVLESPNQIVTLTGEMHGILPVAGQKRLYDVISALGGLPPTASHTIAINRPGVAEPIVVALGSDPAKSALANIPVFAQDTIVISRIGVVYLLGTFKAQGPIPLQQNSPLTLMQATAIGGGVGFEGRYKDLRIIRTVGLERKVVSLDIKKVFNGQLPDPVLQPDDIVFLPTDAMKAAIKGGGAATLLGLASVLIFALRD
jgi:polysaccharide export outer membrane protein